MKHSTVRGNWAGILMMSPDARPIIDKMPEYDGLFCMTGDSGTSFKTSPAIGKCLAEWIVTGNRQTVDLTPFRSTRFAEGKPWLDDTHYGDNRAKYLAVAWRRRGPVARGSKPRAKGTKSLTDWACSESRNVSVRMGEERHPAHASREGAQCSISVNMNISRSIATARSSTGRRGIVAAFRPVLARRANQLSDDAIAGAIRRVRIGRRAATICSVSRGAGDRAGWLWRGLRLHADGEERETFGASVADWPAFPTVRRRCGSWAAASSW